MTTRLQVKVDREKDRVVDLEREKPGHSFFRVPSSLYDQFEEAGEELSLAVTRVTLYDEWIRVYPAGQITLLHHQGQSVIGLRKDYY